jgi:hypothetical protein
MGLLLTVHSWTSRKHTMICDSIVVWDVKHAKRGLETLGFDYNMLQLGQL